MSGSLPVIQELSYCLCLPCCCTVLLQHGADPNIRNTDGKSALDLAEPSAKAVLTGQSVRLSVGRFSSGVFRGNRGGAAVGKQGCKWREKLENANLARSPDGSMSVSICSLQRFSVMAAGTISLVFHSVTHSAPDFARPFLSL